MERLLRLPSSSLKKTWLDNYPIIIHSYTSYIRGKHGACARTQSCLTLCDPTDCSPPGSSLYGMSQARTLEWVANSYTKRSSQPRDQTQVSCISCIGRWILYHWCHLWSPRGKHRYLRKGKSPQPEWICPTWEYWILSGLFLTDTSPNLTVLTPQDIKWGRVV